MKTDLQETHPGDGGSIDPLKPTPGSDEANAPPWPTVEAQQEYWARKEREAITKENLLECVDAFAAFLGEMNDAIGKLRAKIEVLSKKQEPKDPDLSPA